MGIPNCFPAIRSSNNAKTSSIISFGAFESSRFAGLRTIRFIDYTDFVIFVKLVWFILKRVCSSSKFKPNTQPFENWRALVASINFFLLKIQKEWDLEEFNVILLPMMEV